jgi:D-glycero-alpha-D-manno-heptose-7-phosphate kinase
MIIARSPLRITLGGGGTDLPSYYRKHGGYLISAAINKYVYISINKPFKDGVFLKYSQIEEVDNVADVKHPIIREGLALVGSGNNKIEISSLADIPSGTGLGSSGSFTTALLKALYAFDNKHIHQEELAKMACHIEIDRLGEPIGKQDQYIAAIGGVTCFRFNEDDSVTAKPLPISNEALLNLEDRLLLFFTGFSRSASNILKDQHVRSQKDDLEMVNNLHYVKELGYRSEKALVSGDIDSFGYLMKEHWEHKKRRTGGMSNSVIDGYYQLGITNGAIGGKIVGAGGGGFLLFVAKDPQLLRSTLAKAGLQEVRFNFDFQGCKIVM